MVWPKLRGKPCRAGVYTAHWTLHSCIDYPEVDLNPEALIWRALSIALPKGQNKTDRTLDLPCEPSPPGSWSHFTPSNITGPMVLSKIVALSPSTSLMLAVRTSVHQTGCTNCQQLPVALALDVVLVIVLVIVVDAVEASDATHMSVLRCKVALGSKFCFGP